MLTIFYLLQFPLEWHKPGGLAYIPTYCGNKSALAKSGDPIKGWRVKNCLSTKSDVRADLRHVLKLFRASVEVVYVQGHQGGDSTTLDCPAELNLISGDRSGRSPDSPHPSLTPYPCSPLSSAGVASLVISSVLTTKYM